MKICFELFAALLKAMMTLGGLPAELALDPLMASAGEMLKLSKGGSYCAVQYSALLLLLQHPSTG